MCKRFSDGKMWQVFFESLEENACLCEGMSGFCICRLGLYIDRLFSPSISYLVGNTCVASVNKEGKISHGRFQEDLDVSPLSPPQELPGPRFHSQALFVGVVGRRRWYACFLNRSSRTRPGSGRQTQRERAASKQAAEAEAQH